MACTYVCDRDVLVAPDTFLSCNVIGGSAGASMERSEGYCQAMVNFFLLLDQGDLSVCASRFHKWAEFNSFGYTQVVQST